MIGKVIKFFIKLAIGIVIGILVAVFIVNAVVHQVKCYETNTEDVTNMMYVYRNVSDAAVGELCVCPVCGKQYHKKAGNTVCCSPECEKTYWDLVAAWKGTEKNRDFIESHGKNFR